ncbi:HNH endonuclease signature motif containing protein [Sulfurovum riftiae]|uniref:HNH nuclease domain-containing protein n=1 Tax=Sulfurovum riftiae TaxID=1630136 RepID=A0A151CJ46_9BACT|nr:HNH endonuclease signature motif containing protein [Sulfurovum riftiae]KYJ87519.1 hypothetical protein AS592_10455 [Sulfurovum riftiae]
MKQLTQERLKALFLYDPTSGVFTRKKTGKSATNTHNGYIRIGIDYQEYYAHRLAFLYMLGEFPQGVVDHKNHVKIDNRWDNLRSVTIQENSKNTSLYSNNKSNMAGVYWHKRDKAWIACIHVDGKKKHLGCFKVKEDAIAARKKANHEYGFHNNHGQSVA